MEKILVVEDERQLNKTVCDYFEAIGFLTHGVYDGISAAKALDTGDYGLVLLDLMIPGIDGLEFMRKIRGTNNTPVIMVTARVSESDKLIGFELGADDYVTKPYSLKELAARVRAVLRRGTTETVSVDEVIYKDLILNKAFHSAKKNGITISLTAAQFTILYHLISHPGRVFSRLDLLKTFVDQTFEGYERTIDVHIKNIRKLIGDDSTKPIYIETVWGIGYRAAELS